MNIHKINKRKCLLALSLCIIIFISTFIGVVIKITGNYDLNYTGIEGFRYFTVLSNIFVSLSAILCVSFQIDGLRQHNYHCPLWIMNLLYVAVSTVTTTIFVAFCFIMPTIGFKATFVNGSCLYLHLISPIAAIILFCFVNDYHNIKKQIFLLTLIPIIFYLIVYTIMVFQVGKWIDHYNVNKYAPYWLVELLAIMLYALLAHGLRKIHNHNHEKAKAREKQYYLQSDEVSYPTIEEAIKFLAMKNNNNKGNIEVPKRIIEMMNEKYHSNLSINELCQLYVSFYFNNNSKN